MSQSYDLFCRWKHVKKIQSDNAGAIALGVTRATVSSWKQGKNAEIQYVEQMALDIGDSPETWSALVMAERSNSEAEKAAWKRIAQKLASVAMALALGVGLTSPRDAQAAPGYSATDPVYIMRNSVIARSARFVGSAWQWLRLWLGSCLRPGTPDKDELAA